MKRLALFLLPIWLFVAPSGAAMTVRNPGCEHQENPLGVDVMRPHLNWILQSDRQTAYQILAASSQALLKKDSGDLWDSGKLASDETIQILYAGQPLKSSQQVFWKVRVWDADGNVSAWSPTAAWTMGVLNPSEWNAKSPAFL